MYIIGDSLFYTLTVPVYDPVHAIGLKPLVKWKAVVPQNLAIQ
jgi:hypothetical protein